VSHWLEAALQDGLRAVDSNELIERAARHQLLVDIYRDERAARRVSPSLIAEECRLKRIKRYRRHQPRPGWNWGAAKGGRPSAGSALHFARGYFGEGLIVAALSAVCQTYQTPDGLQQGSGAHQFDILGVSPWAVFECEAVGASFLAYPDMIILTQDGGPELIQIKTPSVFAFDRYRRDGGASIRKRYGPQTAAEMYIGRRLGMPFERNHVLCFTWEGFTPGSDEARAGKEIRAIVETVAWEDGMDRFVESIAEEILEDDAAAERGAWPIAYPLGTRWPCDYCNYARTSDSDNPGCEENEKWEPRLLRSMAATPDGSSAPPRPMTSPSPLPPSASPVSPAPTPPAGSSALPPPLPS